MRKATVAFIGMALAASAIAVPLEAQMGLGPVIGVSLANISGADKDNIAPGRKSRTGFVAGAVLDFPVSRMFSIRPEILYVQKGVKFEELGVTAAIETAYIEIPVLLMVGVPVSGTVIPEFFAGPQVSFEVGCNVSGGIGGLPGASVSCDDAGVQLESTIWGIIVGAGIQVSGFLAAVQYDIGLTTLDAEADPFDIKDRTWMFKVGWLFKTR